MRDEGAFTLIEVLVAVIIVSVGVFATLSLIATSHKGNFVAERVELATEAAQREMEQMESLGYEQLALTSTPASSNDDNLPSSRVNVSGTDFEVRDGSSEALVINATDGAVDPGPTQVTTGSNEATVYRYVTWVDGSPPSGCTINCTSTQDYKRITVAVRVPAEGTSGGFKRFVEVAKYRINPDLGAEGQVFQPDDPNPNLSADNFYLYDTQHTSCTGTSYAQPTGDHETHDTRGACGSPDAPDFMDVVAPPNPAEPSFPPLYDYSNDLVADYDGGLAMARNPNDCDVSAAGAHEMHVWTTNPLSTGAYDLSGKVSVDLWTANIGGVSGGATVCFGVFDRDVSGGSPQDTLIAEKELTLGSWPVTPSNLPTTFSHTPYTLPAGHKLRLVIVVDGDSDNGLQILYDHPEYQSVLEVRTTTPVTQ